MKRLLSSSMFRPQVLSGRLATLSLRRGKTEPAAAITAEKASAGKRFLASLLRSFATWAV